MFEKKHFVVKVQKDPPSVDDLLKEPMPVEQKVAITKDIVTHVTFGFMAYKVVSALSDIAVNVAYIAATKVIK